MYLHLGSGPRTFYLVTGSHDERQGRPSRALVFRAGDSDNQVVVEFLRKDQVDLSNTVRITTRVVKGCLGLIAVENGACLELFIAEIFHDLNFRDIPCYRNKCY